MAKSQKDEAVIEIARTLKDTPWCDEYEKMISGMLYNPLQPKLVAARHRVRGITYKFNHLDPNGGDVDAIEQQGFELLQQALGKIGEGSHIEMPCILDYGCNVLIGKNCYINSVITILDTSLVIIGDRVQMGPNVTLSTAGHETSVLSRVKYVEFGHPIRIEDDCWLGSNVTVLPGVTVGRGSTIGAGSVVTRDIPPYSVAVGVPARVIKKLKTIEEEMADPENIFRNMPDRQ